ncbi:MAG TPA: tetratricopeptide repeat protein [Burkholderiaceae bacterium]|nr:tetratricopeptide repeat protein [Burkholderiaceae bacterium]
MRILRLLILMLAVALAASASRAAGLTREQALKALEAPETGVRLGAVERLAEIGRMDDADRLLGRLTDSDAHVRASATDAIWRIWSRSGDPAIDSLFARGVEQMQDSEFDTALATFSAIIARKPDFAEGWNKRATIYFLLGENEKSLKDCDEVLKRNPNHFGALSGAGQIYLRLGDPEQALKSFRRAFDVNPNLEGIEQIISSLERYLRDRDQKMI